MRSVSGEADEDTAFCSVAQAARFLGISRALAYRMVREFEASGGASGLPTVRFGGRLLIPAAALRRLAATGSTERTRMRKLHLVK